MCPSNNRSGDRMGSEHLASIPIIDLSPFFHNGDEAGRKTATEEIRSACQTYGFFRIVNHGGLPELMTRAIDLSKEFFDRTYEEKLVSKPATGANALLPAGYARQPDNSPDKNEYLLLFSPELGCNVYPTVPPEFRATLEECFTQLTNTALLIQDILNEAMDLPPNFLKEHITSGTSTFMTALRYFPATATENNGITEHADGSVITFVFQDDIGGLEVLKDGDWIPAEPLEGSIVVNLGDIVQVLSNNKFKSATHRVVRKEKHRHSYAFFFNANGDKWIEPLPQFAGDSPAYKGFLYKDYIQLRMRNKTHPPARLEDVIDISHYAIGSPPLVKD